MEKLYGELDEAKDEIERLKLECKRKVELHDSLKSAFNEQHSKFQEAKVTIEKLTRQLNNIADEASESKRVCDDLRFNLNDKESKIRQLSAANDKIRVDCDGKLRTWGYEKRGLVLALDEANEKMVSQDRTVCALEAEIKGLKGLLSSSQKKCLEVEEKANESVEMRKKDDFLFNLEEEHRKVEDQLKWKNEQFAHLREAHDKLRGDFKVGKKEWEVEKSVLIDEICSLQKRLDSQTRISEDFQSRLQVCNEALAREESRRKYLEVQVSEFQIRYEHVVAECDDAKLKIETFTSQRDIEIASLRNLLGEKETIHKEMEYRVGRLELENQELLMSVKELQEAGISRAGSSSSSTVKLRNKLKIMEQAHKDCAATLKLKEDKWSSQLEEMTSQMSRFKSELTKKDEELKKLKCELEDFQSSMMQLRLEYEENSALLVALKPGISDAKHEIIEISECNKENEEENSNLMKQLEMKSSALVKAEAELREEREKTKYLLRKVESLKLVEEQRSRMQEDVERYRRLVEESSKRHFYMEDKLRFVEAESREKLSKVCDDLEKAESELAEKYSEGTEVQCEMWVWKSIVEKLKTDLENNLQTQKELELDRAESELAKTYSEGIEVQCEMWVWKSIAEKLKNVLEDNLQTRRELEASLHEQIQGYKTIKQETDNLGHLLGEENRRVHNLELQVVLLEKELKSKQAEAIYEKKNAAIALESQALKHIQILQTKDDSLKDLANEIERLELECLARELESAIITQLDAERVIAFERASLVQLKYTLKDLENELECLELKCLARELESAMVAQLDAERVFASERACLVQLVEDKENRIASLLQQLESMELKLDNSLTSFSLKLLEKQTELELLYEAWEKISAAHILAKLEIQEKNLMIIELEDDICSIQKRLDLREKLLCDSKQKVLETKQLIYKLESENKDLHKSILRLSSEKEMLAIFMEEMSDKISRFSDEDMQLMGLYGRLMQSLDRGSGLELSDECTESVKDKAKTIPIAEI